MEGGKVDDGRYEPTNEEILARVKPLAVLQQTQTQAKQRIVNLLGLALGLGVFLVIALIVTQKQGEPSEGSILTAGEIFMRADNPADYRGGVILRAGEENYLVVKTNISGGAGTVQLKRVFGIRGSPDQLEVEEHTYKRYEVPTKMPDRLWSELPKPGLYVTEYGEYDDSTGLIAVSYNGSLIVGVKMTGNQFVPAGETTFQINMTDNLSVRMQHASMGFKNARWLEKNKDPLNDTIVELIKNGGNTLAIECFKDHPGQPLEAPKNEERKKGKGGKTVSSYFKGQLDDLTTALYKTEPHFIRCVVPNTHKQ